MRIPPIGVFVEITAAKLERYPVPPMDLIRVWAESWTPQATVDIAEIRIVKE